MKRQDITTMSSKALNLYLRRLDDDFGRALPVTDLPTQDADRDTGVTKASPQAKAAKRVVRRAETRMMEGSSRLIEMILIDLWWRDVGEGSLGGALAQCFDRSDCGALTDLVDLTLFRSL